MLSKIHGKHNLYAAKHFLVLDINEHAFWEDREKMALGSKRFLFLFLSLFINQWFAVSPSYYPFTFSSIPFNVPSIDLPPSACLYFTPHPDSLVLFPMETRMINQSLLST